jgi:hypothetical protein
VLPFQYGPIWLTPNRWCGKWKSKRDAPSWRYRIWRRSSLPTALLLLTGHHSLVETAVRVPNGIICLLSALNFHGLTTQLPLEVWLAIENKAWGAPVKIYGPAKTVADCFKYRHKIGLDIALEAMRNGLRQRFFTVDTLLHYAGICRVQNVMRPYLEAML